MVILNRVDYVNKALTLLGDWSKFSKLDSDALELCLKRENELIRLLRDKILKESRISEEVYQQLCSSGNTHGILYGLPKVYKQDCPTTHHFMGHWYLQLQTCQVSGAYFATFYGRSIHG